MLKIDVWVSFPDGAEMKAGEMVCSDPDSRGRMAGAFRYTPEYLAGPKAFALDPVALPLVNEEFETDRPTGVFSVFVDSLPDDWGRKLLVRKAGLKRGEQTVPNLLLALGAHGLGALSYFQKDFLGSRDNYAPETLLQALLDAAEKYEKNEFKSDSELKYLFQAASSPGGGRPKAIVKSEGELWIAKFPSVKDDCKVENIEAATLSLAQKAGLDIPEFKLIRVGSRDVLMVRRFDVSGRGGRFHMISMQTLLKAEGWYNLGYRDMFEVLRVHSHQPEIDLPMMFRQMVFNALIGNTDDHLKNFIMLHTEGGYRLSPAYDLLPDIALRREHVLLFEHDHFFSDKKVFGRIGRAFGIQAPMKMVESVKEVLLGWEDEFVRYAVPENEIQRLEPGIKRRLEAV